MSELDPPPEEPPQYATKMIKGLGDLSVSFSQCVRSLISPGVIRPGHSFNFMSEQNLIRLLRSPSIVSHLYYATLTYHKDEIDKRESFTPLELAEMYPAPELAALLTIVYFYRRLLVRCDKHEWEALTTQLQLYVDLAIPLGRTIPSVGPMRALLVAASRQIGWGTIATQDLKGFKKYRISTKVRKQAYNLTEEIENWRTSHLHIAATMFQMFGFGVETASGFLQGLLASDPEKLKGEELRFRVAQLWLDALMQNQSAPEESLGDDFVLSDDELEPFVDLVAELFDKGSPHSWLSKRKEDISTQKTPKLTFDYERAKRLKRKKPGEKAAASADVDDEVSDESGEESSTEGT